MLTIEDVKKALTEYYGEIDDSGCYSDGKWFSLQKVVDVIEEYAEQNDLG